MYQIYNTKYTNFNYLRADLIQSGMIGLWKASISYNIEKGYKFSTFAYICINNEMKMLLRTEYKHLNHIQQDIDVYKIEVEDIIDIEEDVCNKETENNIDKFCNNVIIKEKLKGKSLRQMEKELGLSRYKIKQVLEREKPIIHKKILGGSMKIKEFLDKGGEIIHENGAIISNKHYNYKRIMESSEELSQGEIIGENCFDNKGNKLPYKIIKKKVKKAKLNEKE